MVNYLILKPYSDTSEILKLKYLLGNWKELIGKYDSMVSLDLMKAQQQKDDPCKITEGMEVMYRNEPSLLTLDGMGHSLQFNIALVLESLLYICE